MSGKFIAAAVGAAIILSAVIIISPDNRQQQDIGQKERTDASDEASRRKYFAMHGWDVEEISHRSITIPSDFSEAYEKYATMQDKQGLPLREYTGQEAVIYTYRVRNYNPDGTGMLAELIVCDDTAIASVVYGDGGTLPVS